MLSQTMTVLARHLAELRTAERGEVNVSMMAWMQLETMLSAAASFVTTTLGI
jgi:hypothetical protein